MDDRHPPCRCSRGRMVDIQLEFHISTLSINDVALDIAPRRSRLLTLDGKRKRRRRGCDSRRLKEPPSGDVLHARDPLSKLIAGRDYIEATSACQTVRPRSGAG